MNPVAELYDALNRHDIAGIMRQCHDQIELTDIPSGQVIRGNGNVQKYYENWLTAFPDGKGQIINQLVTNDQIVVEVVGRGTHQAVFRISEREYPPTGSAVEIRFCQVFWIKDRKIVRAHSYYDVEGFARALSGPAEQKAA